MNKSVIVLLVLSCFIAESPALAATGCKKKLISAAFEIYQVVCGGLGKKSACEVTSMASSKVGITCSYSGEPDYNDVLDVEFTIDSQCEILKKDVKSCYTD